MNFGRIAHDLHADALADGAQPVAGRNAEVDRVISSVSKGQRPRLLLTGPSGVGKSALILETVRRLAAANSPLRFLKVDPAALHADTVLVRENFTALMEHCDADSNIWLVIDDITPLLEPNLNDAQKKLLDIAQTGTRRVLYTLPSNAYRTLRNRRHPLVEDVKVIKLYPTDAPSTVSILKSLRPALEHACQTIISSEAIAEAESLSSQYLADAVLPGSAIDVLTQASQRHRKKTEIRKTPSPWVDKATMEHLGKAVGPHDIRRVVGEMTGYDVVEIETKDWKKSITRLLSQALPERHVLAHRLAARVAMIRQDMVQRDERSAVLVLAGPPNCGKTRAAEALAHGLPGNRQSAFLIDMARFTTPADIETFYGQDPATTGEAKQLAVAVIRGVEHANEELRLRLGKTLATPEPHQEFAWGRNYQHALFIMTLDVDDPLLLQADVVERLGTLLGTSATRLRAKGVNFATVRAGKPAPSGR